MMHYGYGYYPYFGVFSGIVHAIFIIAAVFILIAVLRAFGMMGRGRRWMWHTHSALSILNERYARGEIDKAEYEERKKALMSQ
jgi:putative membrane protein